MSYPPLTPIALSMRKTMLLMLLMLVLCVTGWTRQVLVDYDSEAEFPDGSEEFPYRHVADAITAAEGDNTVDTIIINPGVYEENLSLTGFPRNLTIKSTYDPLLDNEEVILATIIHGVDQVIEPVFLIENCSGQISFWGLSIRNGKGHFIVDDAHPNSWSQGGGICALGNENLEQYVNIGWCNIYENYACWGGGIFGLYASYSITNTNIHDNALFFIGDTLPPDSHGGGGYNGSKGGGVYLAGGWSTISHSKIYDNRSYLEDNHELYNRFCYGNASAVVWRNICDGEDLGMIMENCEVYNNVTKTINEQMLVFDWPFRATIQIQRGVHVPDPGDEGYNHVEINNCTITDNQIISQTPGPLDPFVNTGVGISRHFNENHILGTMNNNIVFNNTAGSSLEQQEVSLVHQLYGGFYENDDLSKSESPLITVV